MLQKFDKTTFVTKKAHSKEFANFCSWVPIVRVQQILVTNKDPPRPKSMQSGSMCYCQIGRQLRRISIHLKREQKCLSVKESQYLFCKLVSHTKSITLDIIQRARGLITVFLIIRTVGVISHNRDAYKASVWSM